MGYIVLQGGAQLSLLKKGKRFIQNDNSTQTGIANVKATYCESFVFYANYAYKGKAQKILWCKYI